MSFSIRSLKCNPSSYGFGERGVFCNATVNYMCETYYLRAEVANACAYSIVKITDDEHRPIHGDKAYNIWSAFLDKYTKLYLLAGVRRSIVFWRKELKNESSKQLFKRLHEDECVSLIGQRLVAKEILTERLDRLIEYTTRPKSEWTQKLYARQMRGAQ